MQLCKIKRWTLCIAIMINSCNRIRWHTWTCLTCLCAQRLQSDREDKCLVITCSPYRVCLFKDVWTTCWKVVSTTVHAGCWRGFCSPYVYVSAPLQFGDRLWCSIMELNQRFHCLLTVWTASYTRNKNLGHWDVDQCGILQPDAWTCQENVILEKGLIFFRQSLPLSTSVLIFLSYSDSHV